MPTKRSAATTTSGTDEVETFLSTLEHERKPEILELRRIILEADPAVTEGIKWNAPSFRTTEYFATFHLRERRGVRIILHRGAKRRADAVGDGAVADPSGLLEWLGPDRASVLVADMADVEAKRAALTALVRAWVTMV